MVEEVKDTIFVGGIPYDMTLEEFEEEVAIWGPVTKKYLKYHGGWGTVTFESNSSRNRFLKDKTRHKVGSKLVDVKPYIYNPEKVNKVNVSPQFYYYTNLIKLIFHIKYLPYILLTFFNPNFIN